MAPVAAVTTCAGANAPARTIVYELSGGDGPTTVALTQDGNDSAEQAEQFSTNWQGMVEGLKASVESS